MPRAHCPRCGATYHTPTTSPNGPVCRYCIASGLIVVLLPVPDARASRRFARAAEADPERARRADAPLRRQEDPRRHAS